MSLISVVMDLLYPPKCPLCKQPVLTQGSWCEACFAKVYFLRDIHLASRNLHALDTCTVLTRYEGKVQKLIRDLKFRNNKSRSPYLTSLLLAASDLGLCYEVDMVVPVPLSKKRLKERGFNQVEAVFRPWAEGKGLRWENALLRKRETLPQWQLSLSQRRENIKGAFTITRPELVKNKHILLVDDIFTSGLTMNACARELKQAGAVKVFGLAIAGEAME